MRAEALAHRHLGKDRKEELSQLDLSHFRENRRRTTCQSLSEKEHKMDGMEADQQKSRTNAQMDKEIIIPENVKQREETAARCTAKIKRRVFRRQARKARVEQLVRYSLVLGQKKGKRKPLTELYVKGHSPEDRSEWQKERQKHCEEAHTDMEETKEDQENRCEYFWQKGN